MSKHNESKIKLSAEQEDAFRAAMSATSMGTPIFITGRAGTGKSTLLREFRQMVPCPVLAPTGIAAVNVGGQTIHSFFGIRPGDTNKVGLPEKSLKVLNKFKAIIVDELSMVRADLLDQMDTILRNSMEDPRPFGGVSMISFGDPWQLEPVVADDEERRFLDEHYRSPFFFDAKVFDEIELPSVELKTIFRQSGEENAQYRDGLNLVREGNLEGLKVFNSRMTKNVDPNILQVTLTNKKARDINQVRLDKLSGDEEVYNGIHQGEFGRELPAEDSLRLKLGARVMMVANNWKEGYINGDMGTVVGLQETILVRLDRGEDVEVSPFTWEKIQFDYSEERGLVGKPTAKFEQFPVKLGWAITAHKCQGQTYDYCHLSLETRVFAHGQAYVALSRCRTLDGLTMGRYLSPSDLIVSKRVKEWMGV